MSLAVLLIDDEPANDAPFREGVRAAATHAKLMIARNGHQGLEILRNAVTSDCDDVAAVFLDLALPGASGIDILRELRMQATTRRIPVIVLTRSQHDVDIWLSYKLGANAYVVKQTDPTGLSSQIEKVAAFWCVHNRRALPT